MPDAAPLVSLVTPSYNQGQFLEQTIQSVMAQDYPNLEYMIIDGGSTDGSLDIIRRYESRLACWISEPDGGSSDAINKGWQRARGDYLWVLNSDDLLLPGALSALVDFLESQPEIMFAYGDIYFIDDKGQIVSEKRFPSLTLLDMALHTKRYPFAGCLMRRSVLETVGYFDTRFRSADDLDYFLRLGQVCRMGHLARFTASFRLHSQASTQAGLYDHGLEVLEVYEKFCRSLPETLIPSMALIQATAHYKAAYAFARSGHARLVRTHLARAIGYVPGYALNMRVWVMLMASVLGNAAMARLMAALEKP